MVDAVCVLDVGSYTFDILNTFDILLDFWKLVCQLGESDQSVSYIVGLFSLYKNATLWCISANCDVEFWRESCETTDIV